ncbi:MAG TPA: response regulator [Anaerolineales bacterium]|nr:response regulator [Anaerolineales bacterium]
MTRPFALIIEDDAQLSDIFSIALQNQFTTEVIYDGGEALQRLKQVVPDLVILDLNLPVVPGSTILALIRQDERLKATRVILATADDRQAELLDNKADIVLLKPISPFQLRTLAERFAPVKN